ncbi:3-hydroxyacyl-ACP dehydratase FabZ family protein [Streptomyces sp. NPDC092296]|uniref:3-hydroxyacyl-ACP dehydratase FabZ family protein n=1 Tax=Streptomyces sp. NPDC092296 TaxID=3366012 RepID=UPI00380B7E4F
MIGVAEIRRVVPHRHPVLLVDQVVEVEPGTRLRARKAVSAAEPCYAGIEEDAAPGRHAYPTGWLLESWAQAAVLLVCWERPNPDVLTGTVALLAGLKGVRVSGAAWPGQLVEHEVRLLRDLGGTAILTGETRCEGRLLLEIDEMTIALRPAETLRGDGPDDAYGASGASVGQGEEN